MALWLPPQSDLARGAREPRLLVPGIAPVAPVRLNKGHPLARDANFCQLLTPDQRYRGATNYLVMPNTTNLAAFFSASDAINIPNDVAYLDDNIQDKTICWSEWVTVGQAVTNRGAWRIHCKNSASLYHIYGGSNVSYRDFSVKSFYFGGNGNIQFNFSQTALDTVVRHIAISNIGSTVLGSINGRSITSQTGYSLTSATNQTDIGRGFDFYRGYIGYFYLFHSGRDQQELNSLTNNPYQIWDTGSEPYLISAGAATAPGVPTSLLNQNLAATSFRSAWTAPA
jgi:hypothetical protein